MSHVDDGMLHAYLDGALSALDAVRVERHVADCTPCRQRLDAARALVQRAARLLEWASPPAERAAPPLAHLRPHIEPRWRVPVTWAATIIIALGVGVYGGQVILRDRPKQEPAKVASSDREFERDRRATPITIVADSPVLPIAPPTATLVEEQKATEARDVATPLTNPTPGQLADAATKARSDSAAALAALGRRQEAQAMPKAAAPPAPAPANAGAAAAGSTSTTTPTTPTTPSSTAGAVAQRESAAVAANQLGAERRAVAPTASLAPRPSASIAEGSGTGSIVTIDSARALLGASPVALPDYPVTAIRARDGAVIVEHVVPPGRLIRLTQRRAAAEEQTRPATEILARYVDGLRVEISGAMAADSLGRLLERARGVP